MYSGDTSSTISTIRYVYCWFPLDSSTPKVANTVQTYVFQGMMVNEFSGRTYSCGAGCHCMYETELASKCQIAGKGVLETYGYREGQTGKWVGILLGITVGYRILGWLVTYLRKS